MDSAAHLAHLRDELDAFRACLDGDLSTPVEHCGDWTLHDLAEHLGRSNLWAAAAVTEQHGRHRALAAPREPAALRRWFDQASATLLHALDTDPATEAWTFYPPHTVGFWWRRRCLETLVHRWDAENALGDVRPLDAELSADGVAEMFDTLVPRQVERGTGHPPRSALRLCATDRDGAWIYGPGVPVATVSAEAENLLLLLWRRAPADGRAFAWGGDVEAGREVLKGISVP